MSQGKNLKIYVVHVKTVFKSQNMWSRENPVTRLVADSSKCSNWFGCRLSKFSNLLGFLFSKLLCFDKRRQKSYCILMSRRPYQASYCISRNHIQIRSFRILIFFNPVTKGLSTLSTLHSTNILTWRLKFEELMNTTNLQ